MPDYLKLRGGLLLFILSAFVCPASAQAPEIEKLPAAGKTLFEKNIQSPITDSKKIIQKPLPNKIKRASFLKSGNGAGDQTDNWKLERGAKELNVEIGIAPTPPTNFNGREFDTTGRKFALLSVRWGRIIGTPKNVTYEYQIEVAPVALAIKNEVVNPAFQTVAATRTSRRPCGRRLYGFAVSPVGFRFLFRPNKRLKPFVGLHAGFIFFRKPVPLPKSLSYDFTGDFGGGIQYQIKKNKAVSFGYRYYHISNMNIGTINPGYNAQIFYVGYSFFYK